MDEPEPLTPSRVVWRGLRRRCPLCASPEIFTSWFTLRPRCPRCNYPTNRLDDQWIGALGMNTIVSFTLLLGAIVVGFVVTYPDPPVATLMAIAVTIAVIVPIAFYPISKSLWSAIDMAMRPPDPDDDIDPASSRRRDADRRLIQAAGAASLTPQRSSEVGGVVEAGDAPTTGSPVVGGVVEHELGERGVGGHQVGLLGAGGDAEAVEHGVGDDATVAGDDHRLALVAARPAHPWCGRCAGASRPTSRRCR